MAVHLVTYDLISPGQEYKSLIRAIERYEHVKALKSAYCIDTPKTVTEVREDLKKHVDKNDKLFVFRLQRNWAADHQSDATEWLKSDERDF